MNTRLSLNRVNTLQVSKIRNVLNIKLDKFSLTSSSIV